MVGLCVMVVAFVCELFGFGYCVIVTILVLCIVCLHWLGCGCCYLLLEFVS